VPRIARGLSKRSHAEREMDGAARHFELYPDRRRADAFSMLQACHPQNNPSRSCTGGRTILGILFDIAREPAALYRAFRLTVHSVTARQYIKHK
jgi:hypothetical protein